MSFADHVLILKVSIGKKLNLKISSVFSETGLDIQSLRLVKHESVFWITQLTLRFTPSPFTPIFNMCQLLVVYIHWLLVVVGRETDSKNRLKLDVEEKNASREAKCCLVTFQGVLSSLPYFLPVGYCAKVTVSCTKRIEIDKKG